MKILFLTSELPFPPDRGARIRDYHLIKNLSRSHQVLLLCLRDSKIEEADLTELGNFCSWIGIIDLPKRSVLGHLRSFLDNLVRGRPQAVHDYFHPAVVLKLIEVIAVHQVDIIQIEHSFLAPYLFELADRSGFNTVLDFHNIGAQQYRRMVGLSGNLIDKAKSVLKAQLMQNWEIRYARLFDRCLVASPSEAGLLSSLDQNLPVSVIPNGVDTTAIQPIGESAANNTLLLIGTMGYPPNADSVIYFCMEILPLIEERIPDINLLVVGHSPSAKVQAFGDRPNITITGSVPEVFPYYQKSSIMIAPLRAGGGTRLKILESMAYGVPVVSTAIGCEGLDVQDGEELLIAEAPLDFAAAVVRLLEDQILRGQLIQKARLMVERKYDWKVIVKSLETVYQEIL